MNGGRGRSGGGGSDRAMRDWAGWEAGGIAHWEAGGINAPTAASRRNTAAGGPSPRRRAAAPTAWRYPRKNGLVLDQQIVEFAMLHAFDQGGYLGARVNEGGAIGVA